MAKQPTITLVSSGQFDTATLNANFVAIRDHFDTLISRFGDAPNTMAGDLDMDSNDIINVGTMDVAFLTVEGVNITNILEDPLNGLTPAEGDLLVWSAGAWTLIPVGTEGQVLKIVSGAPTYAADNDTDTIGITVEEDNVVVETNTVVVNFLSGGANVVTQTAPGQVQVDLDTFING